MKSHDRRCALGIAAVAVAALALTGCSRQQQPPAATTPAPRGKAASAAGGPSGRPTDLIVFCRGERLYTIAPDGSGEQELPTGEGICAAPSWTRTQPRRVLYVKSAPGGKGSGLEALRYEIHELDPSSGQDKVLVPAWAGPPKSDVAFWDLARPQVCPVSGRVAFVRSGGPQAQPVICVLPKAGAKPKIVLKGADLDVAAVQGQDTAWVVTITREDPPHYGLRRTPLKPGVAGTELIPADRAFLSHPACSPDGRQVAYVEGDEPFQGDRVQLLGESGEPESLYVTDGPSLDWPTWSPDGQWIALVRGTPATGSQICLLTVAQPDAEPVVLTEGTQPAWYR